MRDKTIDAALSCPTAANTHGQDRSLRLSFRDPKESSAHCHGRPVRHERLSEGEGFRLGCNKKAKCWCFYGGSAKSIQTNRGGMADAKLRGRFAKTHSAKNLQILFSIRLLPGTARQADTAQ